MSEEACTYACRYGGERAAGLTDSADRKQLPKEGWQFKGRVALPCPGGVEGVTDTGWKNKTGRRPWFGSPTAGGIAAVAAQETRGASATPWRGSVQGRACEGRCFPPLGTRASSLSPATLAWRQRCQTVGRGQRELSAVIIMGAALMELALCLQATQPAAPKENSECDEMEPLLPRTKLGNEK